MRVRLSVCLSDWSGLKAKSRSVARPFLFHILSIWPSRAIWYTIVPYMRSTVYAGRITENLKFQMFSSHFLIICWIIFFLLKQSTKNPQHFLIFSYACLAEYIYSFFLGLSMEQEGKLKIYILVAIQVIYDGGGGGKAFPIRPFKCLFFSSVFPGIFHESSTMLLETAHPEASKYLT